ncbi:MAG: hypothetical protein ABIJ48_05140 [Actinomycetota bacterium]
MVVALAGTTTWFLTRDSGGGTGGTTLPGDDSFPIAIEVLGPGPGQQQGVTATFDLGPETPVGAQTVGPAGGVIVGADGLTITVPAGAHAGDTPYRVTSRVINSHDLPAGVDAVSPLYRVENGAGLSERDIEVDVPISIPSGEFAMGFFYDSATGGFEGMPIVGIDSDSVTLATRHFSEFVIMWHEGMMIGQLPAPVIDTGFRPGVDDWQFPNYGSAAEPGGHCSGQSLSAMWYFLEQKAAGQPALYGRFDNTDADPFNRSWPQTGDLWQDDRDGYRLASAVQAQYEGIAFEVYEGPMQELSRSLHYSGHDAVTFSAFGFAMWLTKEPQWVGIHRWVDDNGDKAWTIADWGGGHAMVVYGATADGLYVADPNYPRAFRTIPWDPATTLQPEPWMTSSTVLGPPEPGVLGPYVTLTVVGVPPTSFNIIGYYEKSALVAWTGLAGEWAKFVDGTVGDDIFPSFTLKALFKDDDGNQQERGFRGNLTVALDEIELSLEMGDSGDCQPPVAPLGPAQPCGARVTIYDGATAVGTAACTDPADAATCTGAVKVELKKDVDNEFGAYIEVERPTIIPKTATAPESYSRKWTYVDFDRFTITQGSGLAVEMVPNESEAAGLDMLVKDAPILVENPDLPGEIIAITASYKAGPAVEGVPEGEPSTPYVPGWWVIPPVPDDVCMGSGWGGADAGFGPNLCIDVRLSLWDGDSSPFDPAVVRTEALDERPAVDPCQFESYFDVATGTRFRITYFPCVDSFTGNVDQGVEIFGFNEEDRNLGVSRYQVRAVVEGVRIDVATAYRNYLGADVRTDRMREVGTALINEIARSIRVVTGG